MKPLNVLRFLTVEQNPLDERAKGDRKVCTKMGRTGGFLDFKRKEPGYRDVRKRVRDFRPVALRLSDADLRAQAARCMDCGTPFCHGKGCPLANVIPEINDMVYRGRWKEALDMLLSTNNFPEFTGRLCPAPCETSCVLDINDEPVTIRQIELAVIEKAFEKGYLKADSGCGHTGKKAAVIGSGPAGLAVADTLNRSGCDVTVYDRAQNPGGLLRYGIPDFKLDKSIIDRRIKLMRDAGIVFETGVSVGDDISYRFLSDRFDAICLAGGSREPRDLNINGRDLDGIHFASEYLVLQNMKLAGEDISGRKDISAEGRRVVVVGGGDTGSDCVGTALRQKALSVTQIEIMPEPAEDRPENTPWPEWPAIRRDSSSHAEGGERIWSALTKEFRGGNGSVAGLICSGIEWYRGSGGRYEYREIPGSGFEIEADLVLLAMGFVGPGRSSLAENQGLARDSRGNISVDDCGMTSKKGLFAAGDMATGQSLIVRAIADGRKAAEGILRYLGLNEERLV